MLIDGQNFIIVECLIHSVGQILSNDEARIFNGKHQRLNLAARVFDPCDPVLSR